MSRKRLKSFKNCVKELSPSALSVLMIGLPLILASMLTFLFTLLGEIKSDPIFAMLTYPENFENILMSLLLTFTGAALFDANEKGL